MANPTGSPYQPSDDKNHDIGPWAESPQSSRVSRYRYDYATQQLQVQWTNGKNHGYVYEAVDRDGYQRFARAASKGKFVNRILNGHPYRLMTVDEVNVPSNPSRRALTSRVVQ